MVMFMHILKTLVQVLLIFFFLIVAFAFAFTVLMQNEVRDVITTNSIFNVKTNYHLHTPHSCAGLSFAHSIEILLLQLA